MRNVKIDIQYDGTNYSGWQIQNNGISIQEKIEHALKNITKEKIKIIGSGRTDAGVHAINQVASFNTSTNIPENKIHIALNSILPDDIRITKASIVESDFNARYSAKKRTYKYVIHNAEIQTPFQRLYSWHRKRRIDNDILLKILQSIKGTHDFTNLCTKKDESHNKTRTIYDIRLKKEDNNINIYITANAFLRKMVRIIIGTSIMILEKGLNIDYLYKILKSSQRYDKIYTAKPHGLFLYYVEY